ncbi:nuclear transport factor 2 family protein [Variovorax sp. HJSM1_2]|uniref:nuclear transport factor 2 family protein n=1 Tax=Variovorax sp. HJSM1_2 TaxID=3366263 RepID=UPI003BDD8036
MAHTNNSSKTLLDLETRFWQSMVAQDTDTAIGLLSSPALMVSAHGALKFDHAAYRKMAEQGAMVVTSFELKDTQVLFPNETTAVLSYRVKQGLAPRGQSEGESVFQEMHDSSTWIKSNGDWKCVMHTESPVDGKNRPH